MSVVGINEVELNRSLERYSMYRVEEELSFNNFRTSLNTLKSLYNTNNTNKLGEINSDLSDKYKVIGNIHNNYKVIVSKNVDKYSTLVKETEDNFSNITMGDNNG